jgi:septal ring factor EnvC (AmiA/AmiB activator)
MRSIKLIVLLLAGLILVAGCGKKKDKIITDLQTEKDQLQANYQQKDSLLNELFFSINSIEKNLADITAREKLITETPVTEKRSDMDVREKIMEEIIMINNIMEENKKRINILKDQLKKSDVKIASLQDNIKLLTQRLEEKEAEINDLKDQLVKLNFTIESLNTTIDTLKQEGMAMSQVISQQDAMIGEMNTIWYVSGTKKELTDLGIIEKAGGMLSGASKMSELINPDHFKTDDMRKITVISFQGKKAELVTIHPEGSFKFIETDEGVQGLEILNPTEFWKSSRFLVVMTR